MVEAKPNAVPPQGQPNAQAREVAPDAAEIEWAGGVISTPPAPGEPSDMPKRGTGSSPPGAAETLDRDVAVNGASDEDADAAPDGSAA